MFIPLITIPIIITIICLYQVPDTYGHGNWWMLKLWFVSPFILGAWLIYLIFYMQGYF